MKRSAGKDPSAILSDSQASERASQSEVQTKLELARQFVDMGDPESARHMLAEVLEEGDAAQKREAQRLADSLP